MSWLLRLHWGVQAKTFLVDEQLKSMNGSREYRQWINNLRKRHGKPNGVIDISVFSHPEIKSNANTSKRNQKLNPKD